MLCIGIYNSAAKRVGDNKKWEFNTVLSSSLKTDECNLEWLLNVAHTAVVLCCFVTISENDNHSLQAIWEYSPQMPLFIFCLHAAHGGNFQKANLRLSEILLSSYLFAAGSFLLSHCYALELKSITKCPRCINMIWVASLTETQSNKQKTEEKPYLKNKLHSPAISTQNEIYSS